MRGGYLVVGLGVAEAVVAGGAGLSGQSVHLRRSRSLSAAPLLLKPLVRPPAKERALSN
jgi:hypothetical protein